MSSLLDHLILISQWTTQIKINQHRFSQIMFAFLTYFTAKNGKILFQDYNFTSLRQCLYQGYEMSVLYSTGGAQYAKLVTEMIVTGISKWA